MPAMSSVSPAGPARRTPSAGSGGTPHAATGERAVALRGTVTYAWALTDISDRDIGKRYRTDTTNLTTRGGCRGPEPDCRPRIRRPWAAAQGTHAWLRAQ